MRELRVVGLGEDTATVVLEDPIRHERFLVPSDERLRAAARGDVRRLGQMEIETTSPLRPRDIQARIRSGESVAEVASGAGVPTARVERFAYPVLLERSRVAEMAGRGHPAGEGGAPDPRSLLEILTATFTGRGQDLEDGSWDAWKGEDGGWIVSLSWRTGHSDHLAHWTFTPGASGGVVVPRDDPARDLLGLEPTPGPRRADGSAARAGRTEQEAEQERRDEQDELGHGALAVGGGAAPTSAGPTASSPTAAAPKAPSAKAPAAKTPAAKSPVAKPSARGSRTVPDQRGSDPAGTERRSREPGRGAAARHRGEGARPDPARPETPRPEARPETSRTDPGRDDGGGDDPERTRGRRGRTHPIVPSWEDVLLGVRSPRS